VTGAYEQELNNRRAQANKIEWLDVDEALMTKLQVLLFGVFVLLFAPADFACL
jgi:uncharacterized protein YhhL (DUF1145 family)